MDGEMSTPFLLCSSLCGGPVPPQKRLTAVSRVDVETVHLKEEWVFLKFFVSASTGVDLFLEQLYVSPKSTPYLAQPFRDG